MLLFVLIFFSDHSITGAREKGNLRCGEWDSCRERMLFTLYNMKASCYNENNTRGLNAYAEENHHGEQPRFS